MEEDTAGAGEATAGAGEDAGPVLGAHMKVRAPGIVVAEEPRDTTSLRPMDADAPNEVESTWP
jgi:hypothetical protein